MAIAPLGLSTRRLRQAVASQFAGAFADVAVPALNEQFAETITRRAGGDPAASSSVTAIVNFDDQMSVLQQLAEGETVLGRGQISCSTSIVVGDRDTWVFNGQEWRTLGISATAAGMQVVEIERIERKTLRVAKRD